MMGALLAAWRSGAATPPPPRRVWRDWAAVAVFGSLVVVETVLRWQQPWVPLWGLVVLALVPTLLARRERPLVGLTVAFGSTWTVGLVAGGSIPLISSGFIVVLVYAVFRWGTGRARLGASGLLLLSLVISLLSTGEVVSTLVGSAAVILPTVLLGVLFRQRAAARLRELEAVRSRERAGLARDLHDIVAHHVSAIVIQAQAGIATAAATPTAAVSALEAIEVEATRTLSDMRAIVRTLRDSDAAELAPLPGIADLRSLTGDAHGAPVELRVDGATDSVPPAIASALYRIAQESVTNARRHARDATRIDVSLVVDDSGATLTVSDDGAPGIGSAGGFGTAGMAERASLLGGSFTAGPAPAGGWVSRAVLPRTGWTA